LSNPKISSYLVVFPYDFVTNLVGQLREVILLTCFIIYWNWILWFSS